MVKSHEKFVKSHEKLRKTSPTPDFCPAFTAKTLNLHHQFLQNEFFRGGDLYYICANLGGFSFRCFFPAKQTLVSSLFSNFALVKRFWRNIDSKKVGCAETFVHDIVGKNKAFAIISRSAKSLGNLLDGNNVTEIIVIRHSVWSVLVYYVIEMHLAIGVVYSLLVDWGFRSEAAS